MVGTVMMGVSGGKGLMNVQYCITSIDAVIDAKNETV